jgi:DNA-binding phage protein
MQSYHAAMCEARNKYLRRLLERMQSVTRAAEVAGLNRTHFYRVLRQAGIEPPRYGNRFVRRGNDAWRSLAH